MGLFTVTPRFLVLPFSLPFRRKAAANRQVGLALVRLRLRLALLTMAIVPVAISMALVIAVLESQGLDLRSRASGESATISTALASQIQRTEGMLQVLAGDPWFGRGLVDPTLLDRARESLHTLATTSGGLVPGAALADANGVVRLRLTNESVQVPVGTVTVDPALLNATLALPIGRVERSDAFRASDGTMQFTLAMPLMGTTPAAAPIGILAFDVSLPALVGSIEPRLDAEGAYALLVDRPTGTVVADSRTLSSPSASGQPSGPSDLGTSLQAMVSGSSEVWQTLLSEGWAAGAADVAPASSGPTWSVVVLQPASPPSFPADLVFLLALAAGVVIVMAVWMSQQILRPAEQLETSRSELRRMYESAREDSLRDALTGLGNHRAFQEEMQRQIEWYRRYHVPVALLLIDVDDLKIVNDSEGHAAGDEQLQHMGQLISQAKRFSDRAFRIGGDEFALLMPHTDVPGALQLGRRLLQRANQVTGDMRPLPFSGGVSACPGLATTRGQLYAQADAALYFCKRHGRSAVDVYDADRDHESDQTVSDELRAAVVRMTSERLLRAVFQPIVDLHTGAILGYEGLIRPTAGAPFSNPGEMFGAADAVGHIVELDTACFDVVTAAARAIPEDKLVSVNLSPRTVEAPDFGVANLLASLEQHGLDPRRVIVELTERESVQDLARLRRNLSDLQAAGIRIAADDVGAGNAGLRLLSQFRFDIVKLDLSLVQDGAQRDTSHAVLRSLRDLAGRWGAFVIAEGVETREQLQMVRQLGMSAGQGYLLGRPGTDVGLAALDLEDLEREVLVMQNSGGAAELVGQALGPAA